MINLITRAKEIAGTRPLARACELKSKTSLKNWEDNGLPMSDLTGKTNYSAIIERETGGEVSRYDLLLSRLADMQPGIIYKLPTNMIRAEPQARVMFPEKQLRNKATAILKDGQETAIKVKLHPLDGQPPMLITHGECRWRAIKDFTDLETIDITLDTKDDCGADRKIRQAADNNGLKLSQWDWVCFFTDLHTNDNMADQAIADELKQHGITGFSRPVIANYRRLYNLPKALQQMIQAEWLSASHGKHLLRIQPADVMTTITNHLSAFKAADEEAPSIKQLLLMMRDAYIDGASTIRLRSVGNGADHRWHPNNFDVKACGCDTTFSLTQSDGLTDIFCTDLKCWNIKQTAAKDAEGCEEEEQPEQTAPINDEPTQVKTEPVTAAEKKPPTEKTTHQTAVKQHTKRAPAPNKLPLIEERLAILHTLGLTDEFDIATYDIATVCDMIGALQENADRYTYLRNRDPDTIETGGIFAGITPDNHLLSGEDLDQAIDAALSTSDLSAQ